jgi:hypothetical protein
MTLIEGSFHVAREIERISKQMGRPVRVLHVDGWLLEPSGHMSVYLQLSGGQNT